MLSSLPLCFALLLCASSDVFAAPQPKPAGNGLSMNLHRRRPSYKSKAEWGQWAKNNREMLMTKYGASIPQKRSSGSNLLVNQNTDSSFYGSLAIGTPSVSYNVILDTGSADLWVADSNCVTGCSSIPTFNTADSSTFVNKSTEFSISYGSGGAAGFLGSDTVQMAGFSVSDQVFAVCDTITSGLLSDPVSGLLGLAWASISTAQTTPFWQALASGGAWDEPLMSFQLTRYLGVNGASSLEPGGTFTMGFVNSSLYTGEIEYMDLVDSGSYWLLSLSSLTAQGTSVTIGSGSNAYAAIDTGTTLVGGPSAYIANLYSQIPEATPGTGDYDGYYIYPCDTDVNVTMSFGGKSWSISNDDFQLTQISQSECVGAFFELTTGNSAPAWIVGDTFLKNVYSVFRYNPPAVGFAALSEYALSMNGDTGARVPTATIGSIAAAVSATGSSAGRNSNYASRMSLGAGTWLALLIMVATAFLS
ncbi:aspartic peptidase A1 [Armillaria gallica]|uniref:Aspartic peptidase A1 n=1 Tax=Armillaria gallica TaxID=47427 RepID=A0A2H3EFE9_ARMGA|nr:aspartic peptidase A1 [Armillaria gallica]